MNNEELDWLFDHMNTFEEERNCFRAWCHTFDYDANSDSAHIRWARLLSDYDDGKASMEADRRYALRKES